MNTYLLFSSSKTFLGEVQIVHGTLVRLSLNVEGERLLGEDCSAWQLEGIPYHSVQASDGVTIRKNVSTQSVTFQNAFIQWASGRGLLVVDLPEKFVQNWHQLMTMPLTPKEQFELLSLMRLTTESNAADWTACLSEALIILEHQRLEFTRAIKQRV